MVTCSPLPILNREDADTSSQQRPLQDGLVYISLELPTQEPQASVPSLAGHSPPTPHPQDLPAYFKEEKRQVWLMNDSVGFAGPC